MCRETIRGVLMQKGCDVWSVSPETTVYDAIAMMAAKEIGAVLVLSDGDLVGIVSERDYAKKVVLCGRSSKATLVREIMSAPVVTITRENTVEECLQLVTHRRIRHLPVMDTNRVIGVISVGDLVKAVIADQAFTIERLSDYICKS
jgi:CBS domain-containing protein